MNAYIAQVRMNLRLTMRDRSVVFFSLIFPMIFFFMFGELMHADQGGAGRGPAGGDAIDSVARLTPLIKAYQDSARITVDSAIKYNTMQNTLPLPCSRIAPWGSSSRKAYRGSA